MREELLVRAPGMKFVLETPEDLRVTPRVIHALGNIKWGFSDGFRPLAVDLVQSKWDKDHLVKTKRPETTGGVILEELVPTSKAVNWAQVIRRYLSVRGREAAELKDYREDEHEVRAMMKSMVDIRNDGIGQAARMQAMKWTRIPGEAKKAVLEKWEKKARNNHSNS